jgi:hypothetical protein
MSGNSDYTRDVAERGLQAVRDRRQASQYGPNNRDAALEYMLQTGYGPRPQPNASYQQWAQSRGFQPQGYDIAVGQGDGKYNGFETEGQLKSAVLGRSEYLRQQDWAQADELTQLADQYLSDAESQYETTNLGTHSALIGEQSDPAADYAASQHPLGIDSYDYQEKKAVADDELNAWLGETTAPYLDALDTATLIEQTPLRDYATLAGGEYGVDPNIIGGWYPQDTIIGDMKDQRDLNAINTYGMTDAEFQQFIDQQMRQEEQAGQDEQAGYDQQVDDAIFSVTGMDASQLASAADLNTEQLYGVVASEAYSALNGELSQLVQSYDDPEALTEAVDQVLAQASMDPTLYRVLYAQWGGYASR